jgi:putative tricarboxylic transport membrane protein
MGTLTQHLAAGLFWTLLGLFASLHAYRLGIGHLQQPGPGFIFFLSGIGLTLLGIVNLFMTAREKASGEVPPLWRGLKWYKVLFVLIALALFGALLNSAGFLLSTFLLMLFLFKGVEPTRWWVALGSSVVTVLLSYLIFVKWLEVPFPMNVFGF